VRKNQIDLTSTTLKAISKAVDFSFINILLEDTYEALGTVLCFSSGNHPYVCLHLNVFKYAIFQYFSMLSIVIQIEDC
jgi:hypothetical protein